MASPTLPTRTPPRPPLGSSAWRVPTSQNGDELVTCINDRDTITLASAVANDSVTINGLTFYGKTSTAVAADRRFSVDTRRRCRGSSLPPASTTLPMAYRVSLLPPPGTCHPHPRLRNDHHHATSGAATIVCKAAAGVEGITAVNASGVVAHRNSADYTVTTSTDGGAPQFTIPAS